MADVLHAPNSTGSAVTLTPSPSAGQAGFGWSISDSGSTGGAGPDNGAGWTALNGGAWVVASVDAQSHLVWYRNARWSGGETSQSFTTTTVNMNGAAALDGVDATTLLDSTPPAPVLNNSAQASPKQVAVSVTTTGPARIAVVMGTDVAASTAVSHSFTCVGAVVGSVTVGSATNQTSGFYNAGIVVIDVPSADTYTITGTGTWSGGANAGASIFAIPFKAIPSGTSVGQVSETDVALSIVAFVPPTVGLALEQDLAQPIGGVNVAQLEDLFSFGDDTGNESSLGGLKLFGGFPASAGAAGGVGQASESDSAQPIGVRLQLGVGQASETDTAQPVTMRLLRAVGQASESDSAQPIGVRLQLGVGQASETDAAQGITLGGVGQVVGQASEADAAQPVGVRLACVVGLAAETDSAQPVARRLVQAIGQAGEADAALGILVGGAGLVLGVAAETDAAQPIAQRFVQTFGQASEVDTAQQLRVGLGRTVGQASETDAALAVSQRLAWQLGLASEIDTALVLTVIGGTAPPVAGRRATTTTVRTIARRSPPQLRRI